MKFVGIFIILILVFSCSSEENSLEQYANHPVKFAKQKIDNPDNDFSIFIPKNWEWKAPYKENGNDILGLFANSKSNKNGFKSIILVKKYKSSQNSKDLKSEFEYLSKQIRNHSQIEEIVDFGSTDIFNQESYFFHTKSKSDTNGDSEILNFLINGNIEGIYYNLTLSTPQTTDFNTDMAVLVQSLKTFEILK
ncbi:hypothetical protein [Maribacter aquivivus]|uniref:hypothetical protein n=1 Tax=Maribacter aquivivus TaxID=228958 RepID=UPI0024921D31|nr:hypothetical protein [Maribacter aquivivus]